MQQRRGVFLLLAADSRPPPRKGGPVRCIQSGRSSHSIMESCPTTELPWQYGLV